MRRRIVVTAVTACLGYATLANAETFRILPDGRVGFDVVLTTRGAFTCLRSIPCSGSGTSSITVGTGDNRATFTFDGIENHSFTASNVNTRVELGSITGTANPGFTWPTFTNPRVPILAFNITLEHDLPVPATRTRTWGFGPGGNENIALLRSFGGTYSTFPVGANPPGYNYTGLVYTYTPFPFTIPGNGSVAINADVGAVPEPTTIALLGMSVAGAAYARRKRRGTRVPCEEDAGSSGR